VGQEHQKPAIVLGQLCYQKVAEKLVITGKFEGKTGRTKPRTSFLASLRIRLGLTANENTIIKASAKKDRRCDMIANARTGHDTGR